MLKMPKSLLKSESKVIPQGNMMFKLKLSLFWFGFCHLEHGTSQNNHPVPTVYPIPSQRKLKRTNCDKDKTLTFILTPGLPSHQIFQMVPKSFRCVQLFQMCQNVTNVTKYIRNFHSYALQDAQI